MRKVIIEKVTASNGSERCIEKIAGNEKEVLQVTLEK
jgi:hypothetical protein